MKLVLGCGKELKKDWINTNLFIKPRTVEWYNKKRSEGYTIQEVDVTKPLPYVDNQFDYIFSEHMIEHLHEEDGINCLKECLRILKPGGVIRTIAPDRTFYENMVNDDKSVFVKNYCTRIFKTKPYIGVARKISHRGLNEQGHYWVPTIDMLIKQHENVGFKNVKQCNYGESAHEGLAVDLVDGLREYESIIVEGIK